jgi:tetratricopeptide (TPR) repeat protein
MRESGFRTPRVITGAGLAFILAAALFGALTYSFNMRKAALHPAQSHTAMGDTYRFLNRQRLARKHYEIALKSNPGEAKAHFGMGMMVFADGDVIHGLKYFMNAARLDPALSEAHYNIGVIELAAGHDEIAARSLVLSADTDRLHNVIRSATALTMAAGVYLKSGRIHEAELLVDRALRLVPQHGDAAMMRQKIKQAGGGIPE